MKSAGEIPGGKSNGGSYESNVAESHSRHLGAGDGVCRFPGLAEPASGA